MLVTRPWLRAPVLLWRQPGLLLALAAAAFVAVLPAASAPLFLSSARTAALHHQLDNTCAAKVGLHLESRRSFRDLYRALRAAARSTPPPAPPTTRARRAVGRGGGRVDARGDRAGDDAVRRDRDQVGPARCAGPAATSTRRSSG